MFISSKNFIYPHTPKGLAGYTLLQTRNNNIDRSKQKVRLNIIPKNLCSEVVNHSGNPIGPVRRYGSTGLHTKNMECLNLDLVIHKSQTFVF